MTTADLQRYVKTENHQGAYELRIYDVAPGKMDRLFDMFRTLVLPMLGDYGVVPERFWTAPDESRLYYIVRHESVDAIAANWKNFYADSRWIEGFPAHTNGDRYVLANQSIPLVAITDLLPTDG